MKNLQILGVVAGLALFAQPALSQDSAASDHIRQTDQSVAEATPVKGSIVITAKVNGLVCDFCAQALKKVFKKQDAVESLDVDLNAGEVLIGLKPGAELADDRVELLIRKSGYSLVDLTRGPAT